METHLAEWIKGTQDGDDAESILRACVHCGFCNATCPTYQVLGDELDGPRGRIYQIKQVLEGAAPTQSTQLHLDRCLTCLNCETTCPSGVRYGRLVDIGRMEVERRVARGPFDSAKRNLLRFALTRRWVFDPAVKLGRALRPLLPTSLRKKLPLARPAGVVVRNSHSRKVILLKGCVQPALMPVIDAATARVLDALGVEAIVASESGCCGAIDYHLNAHDAARVKMRRNIDAWWPLIDAGAEAVVANASGCGAMLKDYAHALRDDPVYAKKATHIVSITRDLSEFLAPSIGVLARKRAPEKMRVAFHPPCTLQHTQKIRGVVENILTSLGADLVPVADAHLCCGSAGTYSILQPELSQQLRARKLDDLQRNGPDIILSANIGCLSHLETGANVPVRHWIEWVDQRMQGER
ncbi:MAG TPA: glycolate oxidase subunit GlcF [Rudaea sp.]|jgi:glycolate oxidase iron-sulfur subunit|nr:glycolate oxidase subunit GlcF [Rudaea sp.]